MHNSAIARFSRTTAVTFKAGVPLVEALGIVAGATGNTVYEEAVLRMRDDVSVGYPGHPDDRHRRRGRRPGCDAVQGGRVL
ncbi:hypothetical protein G6F46_015725 [Rhizopus delemar]|nr:hypothetical protein G6F46_015725 [Rhizopus delemar]